MRSDSFIIGSIIHPEIKKWSLDTEQMKLKQVYDSSGIHVIVIVPLDWECSQENIYHLCTGVLVWPLCHNSKIFFPLMISFFFFLMFL